MKKEFENDDTAFDLNGDGVMDEQEWLAASFVMDEEEKEDERNRKRNR